MWGRDRVAHCVCVCIPMCARGGSTQCVTCAPDPLGAARAPHLLEPLPLGQAFPSHLSGQSLPVWTGSLGGRPSVHLEALLNCLHCYTARHMTSGGGGGGEGRRAGSPNTWLVRGHHGPHLIWAGLPTLWTLPHRSVVPVVGWDWELTADGRAGCSGAGTLTSSVLVAQVGEAPHVTEAHGEAHA